MRRLTLGSLISLATLAISCSPDPWVPPSEEIRNRAFANCLRGQLETCGFDPTLLETCTAFDWDTVFVVDEGVLSWAINRRQDSHGDLVRELKGRSDLKMMPAAASAFVFFDGGIIIDVHIVEFSEIDCRDFVGAMLSPEEALFSNRSFLGVYDQPRPTPFFEAPQELRDELIVSHVSRRIIGDTQNRNFCVTDLIAPLIPTIENRIRSSSLESQEPKRLFPFYECRMPSSPIDETVTVAATGEKATKLFFSTDPVFFSGTKAKINYGSYTASLSSFSASSIVILTDRGWETQASWVHHVS